MVPLVKMITDECRVAFGARLPELRATKSSRVSSVLPDGSSFSGFTPPSARSLPSGGSALATAWQYSSS